MNPQLELGTSLLEALFAVSVFGIVSIGVMPGFLLHFQEVTRNEHRSNAVGLAQEILDESRASDPASMLLTGVIGPTTYQRGNYTYTGSVSYCEDSSLCPSSDTRHLTVRIFYQQRMYYEVETVFTALR